MPKSLTELAELMRDADFAMLSTHTQNGAIAARPMSNNRDVEYDGDNWFFACDDTRLISDLGADANVGLAFQARSGLLGMKPVFVHVEGRAELIRDKAQFAAHWTRGLSMWFEQGVDTPGLVLIRVRGCRAHYWDGEDQGEIVLAREAA
jgi:general stress protein 26